MRAALNIGNVRGPAGTGMASALVGFSLGALGASVPAVSARCDGLSLFAGSRPKYANQTS